MNSNNAKAVVRSGLVRIRQLGWIAALIASSLSNAMAGCQLAQLGDDLPVDLVGPRAFVWAKINGAKARFVLGTGSFYSTLWRDAAAQYRLPITSMPGGHIYYVGGTAGSEEAEVATVESFEFLGARAAKPLEFLVVDQHPVPYTVGVLGQNILRMSDVEYDLADGVLRFFKPAGCEHQQLAYWSRQYSFVELAPMDASQSTLRAIAMVNGHRVTVGFDTGSPRSFLSIKSGGAYRHFAERPGGDIHRPDARHRARIEQNVVGPDRHHPARQ